jgi:hypothetical protein
MKTTAGPARVIRARAAKLEIRWKSMPKGMPLMRLALGKRVGLGAATLENPGRLCDGLSQPLRPGAVVEE